MSDHLGWAPAAGTHRAPSGGSLGSVSTSGMAKEHKAPEGQMRICAKCRKNRLASLNKGPCQQCRSKFGRRIKFDAKKDWCLTVPVGTPLPVPEDPQDS